MYSVAIALIPAVAAGVFFFGWRALAVVLTSVGAALAVEVIWQRLRGIPLTVSDGSAIVTGMLLALNLPPTAPLWIAALGSAVAIIIGNKSMAVWGQIPLTPL